MAGIQQPHAGLGKAGGGVDGGAGGFADPEVVDQLGHGSQYHQGDGGAGDQRRGCGLGGSQEGVEAQSAAHQPQ